MERNRYELRIPDGKSTVKVKPLVPVTNCKGTQGSKHCLQLGAVVQASRVVAAGVITNLGKTLIMTLT